jgi:hypothetical protein
MPANVLQAGERPTFLKIVTSKVKHSFYKLNDTPSIIRAGACLLLAFRWFFFTGLTFNTNLDSIMPFLKKYFRDFCSARQSSSKLGFALAFRKNSTASR